MLKTQDMDAFARSERDFLADMALRSLDCRDWILGLGGVLTSEERAGLTHLPEALATGLRQLHRRIVDQLRSHLAVTVGSRELAPDAITYHPKFGWVVESEGRRSFLGKTALQDGIRVRIGHRTYLSGHSLLRGGAPLAIGSFSSIGEGFYVNTVCDRNPLRTASTYHFQCSRLIHDQVHMDIRYAELEGEPAGITIGHNVWIGRNVRLYHGARIGNGCVVAEGSLVRGELVPYGLYAGRPAKLKRMRFPEATCLELEKLAWWDWPLERIARNVRFFEADLEKTTAPLETLVVP